jgi:hypothetical protein
MSTRQRPQPFSAAELESLCKALADTTSGLTGTEIGQALRQVGVDDLDPALTKWKRLFNALAARQNRDRSGDRVLAFISHALAPARYRGQEPIFHERRAEVNVTLAFHGLEFCEDGKFRRCTAAATLAEAEERAGRLRKELERRRVEPDVLAFCRPELLADNYFHAVSEATKSVASAIRLRPATALSWRSRPSVGATRRYGSTRSAQTPSGASNVGSRTCLWASSARSGTRPHTPPASSGQWRNRTH